MDARNNIATDLFYKIRSRFSGLKLGGEAGQITINPEEARFFDFDYMEGKTPIGHVSISLAEPNSMKVYFSNGIKTMNYTIYIKNTGEIVNILFCNNISEQQISDLQLIIVTAEVQGNYFFDGQGSVWSDDVNSTLVQLSDEFRSNK